jgi:hypothetical protein
MQGAKENEKVKITGLWEILPKVDISGIGFFAGKYSQENKLREKGVSLIDSSIIYATISTKSQLLKFTSFYPADLLFDTYTEK